MPDVGVSVFHVENERRGPVIEGGTHGIHEFNVSVRLTMNAVSPPDSPPHEDRRQSRCSGQLSGEMGSTRRPVRHSTQETVERRRLLLTDEVPHRDV
jgi:hypothetical protein